MHMQHMLLEHAVYNCAGKRMHGRTALKCMLLVHYAVHSLPNMLTPRSPAKAVLVHLRPWHCSRAAAAAARAQRRSRCRSMKVSAAAFRPAERRRSAA